MPIVRNGRTGRKPARSRARRPFGFQPLERRAMLAADLGADFELLIEPTTEKSPDEVQIWEADEATDDSASFTKSELFEFDDSDFPADAAITFLSLIPEEAPPEEELYIRFRTFAVEGGAVEGGAVEGGAVEGGAVEGGDAKDQEVGEIVEFAATSADPFSLENDAPIYTMSADSPDLAAMTGGVFTGNGWHNVDAPHDVNADGYVSPIDALLLITYLNDHGVGEFGEGEAAAFYPDIDGDGQLAPLDALLMFNYLNENLPALDQFAAAADEALSENEAAGLVASRMAIRDDAFAEVLLDDAPSDVQAEEGEVWEVSDLDDAVGRLAVWADESSPDFFLTEIHEKQSDDATLDSLVEEGEDLPTT